MAEEADLAITNGGAGTTERFYLRGLPQLLLPLHTEQRITARRLEALGAAGGAGAGRCAAGGDAGG